jgi:NAD-dependent DNA ligase
MDLWNRRDKMQAINDSELRDLIEKTNYYTRAYDEGNPEISDQEWDDLYFKLVQLEKDTNTYYEDSPTQRINKLNGGI